ncbi:ZIP family zinc transporter [Peptoniphilus olsenii]|uniref:ZIP family zinc transporter n=1 Tax=Peptoniphilus olsenii TaxID=411570 RepID=A0ABV2JF33_9FIRM
MDLSLIILGCIIPGVMTGVGAIPIFFAKNVSQKVLDIMLALAAGIMLSATCFSLIIPSLEAANGSFSGVMATSIGIFVGALMLDLIDEYAPHEHLLDHRIEGGAANKDLSKIWLFIIAITIHNFPEGLATGVGFGGENVANGIPIAIGISLQNMPEGLAVAFALVSQGYSRNKSFWTAMLTGLVEPIGAFLGVFLVSAFEPILGFILALAGGAMLFVISDEIIPETHSNGYEREATYGIVLGFIVMMVLDVLF